MSVNLQPINTFYLYFKVSPTKGEVYYMRLLLKKFSVRSYAELKTVNGRECTTFQEAANFHGLLKNENRFIEALIEATGWATGSGAFTITDIFIPFFISI